MSIDTLIFCGPTLHEGEVHAIMPEAFCHAPVACGDIIRCLRLKPRQIIIIDGYFEQQGAVWHKEILQALAQGIQVFGASSMGALRAAELSTFGMVGFGEIYRLYKDAVIIDDDEVALIHHTDPKFTATNTALINDRFTLAKAVDDQVIDQGTADKLLQRLKAKPYFQRSLFSETTALSLTNLGLWLNTNYVDQKKIDALGLLQALLNQAITAPQVSSVSHATFFT